MSKPSCSVEGCNRTSLTRTWCQRHYLRWYHHGDPGPADPKPRRRPQGLSADESLRHIGWDVTDAGCWEWQGLRHPTGYGYLKWQGEVTKVHRLAYEVWVGPIPEGHLIRHKCDNKPCINPAHLDTGTHADNMRDRMERGVNGEPWVVSEEDVHSIRKRIREGESQISIAESLGIDRQTVSSIHRRVTWAWLEEAE